MLTHARVTRSTTMDDKEWAASAMIDVELRSHPTPPFTVVMKISTPKLQYAIFCDSCCCSNSLCDIFGLLPLCLKRANPFWSVSDGKKTYHRKGIERGKARLRVVLDGGRAHVTTRQTAQRASHNGSAAAPEGGSHSPNIPKQAILTS